MSGGQSAALISAILLLLPGGCFMYYGLGLWSYVGGLAAFLIFIGLVLLSLAAAQLFRFAFPRPEPPEPPDEGRV